MKKIVLIALAISFILPFNSCNREQDNIIENEQIKSKQSGEVIGGFIVLAAFLTRIYVANNNIQDPIPNVVPTSSMGRADIRIDSRRTNINFDNDGIIYVEVVRTIGDNREYALNIGLRLTGRNGVRHRSFENMMIPVDLSQMNPTQTTRTFGIRLFDNIEAFHNYVNTQSAINLTDPIIAVEAILGQHEEGERYMQFDFIGINNTVFGQLRFDQHRRRLEDAKGKNNISVSDVLYNSSTKKYYYKFLNKNEKGRNVQSFVNIIYENPKTKVRYTKLYLKNSLATGIINLSFNKQVLIKGEKYFAVFANTGVLEGKESAFDGVFNSSKRL